MRTYFAYLGSPHKALGFTLIELVTVLVIMSSVVWLALPSVSSLNTYRQFQTLHDLEQLFQLAQLSALADESSSTVEVELGFAEKQLSAVLKKRASIDTVIKVVEAKHSDFYVDDVRLNESRTFELQWNHLGELASSRGHVIRLGGEAVLCLDANGAIKVKSGACL